MSVEHAAGGAAPYVSPVADRLLQTPSIPLLVAADERTARTAGEHGFACLGVSSWDALDAVPAVWDGRQACLLTEGAPGEREVSEWLAAVGAVVCPFRLPAGPDGSATRLDVYLARSGPHALRRLMCDALPADPADDPAEAEPTPADRLVAIARGRAELWHDPTQAGFASVGRRVMPVKSKAFRNWLIRHYREATGGQVPTTDALATAGHAVQAGAVIDGPEHEAHVRVAGHGGRVYLHLADEADTVIEIDADGWRECARPPVRFRRPPAARPLPRPEPGGSLDALRGLLALSDGDPFALLVGFLVGALMPGQPHPVLVVNGEQGGGKTTVSRVVKALIDPSAAPVRAEPKGVRDLMIATRHNHLLAFDNLSRLSPWLSDAVCRLASGGGFATRELYTDDGEVVFDARRPVILNGVEEFVTRGDLLERSILLRLPSIPEERRVPESDFWGRFDAARPKLLGALLDRVAGGLREWPRVHLDRLPRMADFARWCVACERGAGEAERFLAAYTANQGGAHEQAVDESEVAAVVVAFMADRAGWEGAPTDLHRELGRLVAPPARGWPKGANALVGQLRRLAPHLRHVYRLDFQTDRKSDPGRRRVARLTRLADGPARSRGGGPPTPDDPGRSRTV